MDLSELKTGIFYQEDRHPWECARLEIIRFLMAKVLRGKNQKNGIVLDIGCGDIFIINSLAKFFPGFTFYGIDSAFNDAIKKEYQKHALPNIRLHSDMDDASAGIKDTADIVLLLDVIEHIENDLSFLKRLAQNKVISGHTKLIVTVPAFQFLFINRDKFLRHYRRYNNKLLASTLHESGIQVDRAGYFFFLLLLPRFFQVLFEKIFKIYSKDPGIGNYKKKPVIDTMMKFIMLADFKICWFLLKLGIRLPGLTDFALCQKRAS